MERIDWETFDKRWSITVNWILIYSINYYNSQCFQLIHYNSPGSIRTTVNHKPNAYCLYTPRAHMETIIGLYSTSSAVGNHSLEPLFLRFFYQFHESTVHRTSGLYFTLYLPLDGLTPSSFPHRQASSLFNNINDSSSLAATSPHCSTVVASARHRRDVGYGKVG